MDVSKVNLRSMIRLDQVEDLLTNLIDRINRQDKIIESMHLAFATFAKQEEVNHRFSDIYDSVIQIGSKLNVVEVAATARLGDDKTVSAGELSYLNSLQLQHLSRRMQDFAKRVDVEQHFDKFSEKCSADVQRIYDWAAPLEMANHLKQSNYDVNARLTSVESLVCCKVDKSEIENLNALASRLELYDLFRNGVEDDIRKMKAVIQSNAQKIVHNAVGITSNGVQIEQLHDDIKKLAPRSDTKSLAKQLESQLQLINDFARKSEISVKEVDGKVDRAFDQLTLTNDRIPPLQKQIDATAAQLPGKATVQDVRACVLRSHYDQAVTALGSSIDTKAATTELISAAQRIQTLEETLSAESVRLTVAIRFVEWFTSRGVQYEHNLQVIDRHLGNLTKSAHPGNRNPFEGQIRFTPVMEAAAPASRRDPYGQAEQCTLGGSASTTHDRGEVAGGGGGGPRSHAEPHLAAQGREYSGYSGLPSYGALPPFALSQSEV